MPTSPSLYRGSKAGGIGALALFAVLIAIVLQAEFPDPAGIARAANVTASIGFAMFDIAGAEVPSESFLAVFIIIALVLDAALGGSIMLATRDDESGGDR